MPESLGKVVAVHGIAPTAIMRVVVVAALSFVFFIGTFVAFYISQRAIFFLLSSGFLVIYVLTMLGWFALRRNEVRIHEGGLLVRKTSITWDSISKVERVPNKGLRIETGGRSVSISESLAGLDAIEAEITRKISGPA